MMMTILNIKANKKCVFVCIFFLIRAVFLIQSWQWEDERKSADKSGWIEKYGLRKRHFYMIVSLHMWKKPIFFQKWRNKLRRGKEIAKSLHFFFRASKERIRDKKGNNWPNKHLFCNKWRTRSGEVRRQWLVIEKHKGTKLFIFPVFNFIYIFQR